MIYVMKTFEPMVFLGVLFFYLLAEVKEVFWELCI